MLQLKRGLSRGRELKKTWQMSFFMIWLGQAFLLCGGSLVQFAVAWWITRKTGSAMALSISTAAIFIPQIFVGPIAGIIGDRYDRKRMMAVSYSAVSLLSFTMTVVFYLKLEQLWQVYLLLTLLSVSTAFQWIAMHASIASIVPEQHLTRTAGINQVVRAVTTIAAPTLGAVLIEKFSMASVFSVYFLSSILAVASLILVSIPKNHIKGGMENGKTQFVKDFIEGIQYLKKWRGMMILLIISSVLTLLYIPVSSLAPLLIESHFKGGIWHFSMFETAGSIGTLAGGLLLGTWGGFKRKILTVLTGGILSGTVMVILGCLPGQLFILAVLSSSLYRFAFPLADGPILAMIQSKAPGNVQGRLLSMVNCVMFLMAPVGFISLAPLADYVGVRVLYFVCGVLVLIIGTGSFLIKPLMKIEE